MSRILLKGWVTRCLPILFDMGDLPVAEKQAQYGGRLVLDCILLRDVCIRCLVFKLGHQILRLFEYDVEFNFLGMPRRVFCFDFK